MSSWNPFHRPDPLDDDVRDRLVDKRNEIQERLGIDDAALRALRRRLETEIEILRSK